MADSSQQKIAETLRIHYSKKFSEFGPTPMGVDWGPKAENALLRYRKMLELVMPGDRDSLSLLDVGCGYGGLYEYARNANTHVEYWGIDVAENMVNYAAQQFPEAKFICGDIFDFSPSREFDYVVCNGILTQKLSASIIEMDSYSHALIRKMFSLCAKGVAFNVMSTKVNFTVDNLYYRSPVELFAFCFSEITSKLRLDHSYPLFEYTLYLYK